MVARPVSHLPRPEPTPIESGAAEHLRYIRTTMEASQTFTTVPGKGCVAMGLTALAAAALEGVPALAPHWMSIWLGCAAAASILALGFMESKAKAQGLSLRRAVARRFFLTLAPPFAACAILTLALAGVVERDVLAGMWLLLYGAGVAACGVFSIPAVLAAGGAFMSLGAVALLLSPAAAPLVLALGFGGVHLVLGVVVMMRHGG